MDLRSSKGMDKGLRSATFKASNLMYRLRLLRENLIGNDNHEIIKTRTLFKDSTLPHSYAYQGQKGDNYGTT